MINEKAGSDVEYLFIGEGTLKSSLSAYIDKHGLCKQVRLLGQIPNIDVRKIFERSKILALPSSREAFGIVLLEAMNAFTPCVVTNIGGMPELVDSSVGTILKSDAPESIATAVAELINDERTWERKARLAYQRSLQYDMHKIGVRLISALEID